ncbi:MAG: hypothetical protein Q8N99_07470 [Nanoarchaeota archaeon]|nr:hypothetical protein [Nanoarchaeota archaeon]
MPNQFYDILKKLFSRPKKNTRYLVVVIEKCHFMQDELGLVYIVESPNKVKRGMHHSYLCDGLSSEMSVDEIKICERCGYQKKFPEKSPTSC